MEIGRKKSNWYLCIPIGIAAFKIGLDGVIMESRLTLLLSAIVLIGMNVIILAVMTFSRLFASNFQLFNFLKNRGRKV